MVIFLNHILIYATGLTAGPLNSVVIHISALCGAVCTKRPFFDMKCLRSGRRSASTCIRLFFTEALYTVDRRRVQELFWTSEEILQNPAKSRFPFVKSPIPPRKKSSQQHLAVGRENLIFFCSLDNQRFKTSPPLLYIHISGLCGKSVRSRCNR